jgi:hypothetical protein
VEAYVWGKGRSVARAFAVYLVQTALDSFDLTGHLEFGKDGKRLLQFLPFSFAVMQFPRQQCANPSWFPISRQIASPFPSSDIASSRRPQILQDQGLIPVARLQSILATLVAIA